jgi:hypothetical protein
VGRPDIDAFETALRRSRREKGFVGAFDFSSDALREILDEQIARKLV